MKFRSVVVVVLLVFSVIIAAGCTTEPGEPGMEGSPDDEQPGGSEQPGSPEPTTAQTGFGCDPSSTPIQEGVTINGQVGSTEAHHMYCMYLAPGMSSLAVSLSTSGSLTLHVTYGNMDPSISPHWSSPGGGTINIPNPDAGTYYFAVVNDNGGGSYSLVYHTS